MSVEKTDSKKPDKKAAVNVKGGISNVTTFLGRRPPTEVKQMLESIPGINKALFRKVVQFVIEYLRDTEITEDHWGKIIEGLDETGRELVRLLFAGLLVVLRTAIREKISEDEFKQDLGLLQMPPEFVVDLASMMKKGQADTSIHEKHVKFPYLTSLDWRVDVTISTSEMSRILKPTILMRMTDSTGKIRTFELTTEQFHKLRYSAGRVLKITVSSADSPEDDPRK